MTIGELADRVGAAPSALRYWERAGLLGDVERVDGRRRYPPETPARIGVIRLCQDAWFGIGEIRTLLDTDPEGGGAWRVAGKQKLADLRDQIARLEAAAEFVEHVLHCPHPSLSACPTFAAFVRWRVEGGEPPVNA